jgi:hypothetical protein
MSAMEERERTRAVRAERIAAGHDSLGAGPDPLASLPDEPELRGLEGDPLPLALSLMRQLIRSNLDSLDLAKDLMLAQEVADIHTARMDHAIEHAAASEGDQAAVDRAVAAATAAEHAHVAELTLGKAWGIHLGEVHRLVEVAGALVDRLSPPINLRAAHEPADSLR